MSEGRFRWFVVALGASFLIPAMMWFDGQQFVVSGLRGIATGRGVHVHPALVLLVVGGLNVALGRFYLLAADIVVPFYGVLGAGLVGTGLVRETILLVLFGVALWGVAAMTGLHRRAFG